MPVTPVEPGDFDLARFGEHALAADERYAEFLRQDEGVAVWQRVRVAEVFREGCRDMRQSLRWQLGGLTKSLEYLTDAPTYLEPWYGIGTTASAFGGDYVWPAGEAPVVRSLYKSIQEVPELVPGDFGRAPIMVHTLEMIEYFLEQTQGRVPISWSDVQSPLNVAMELVDTGGFLMGLYEAPERVEEILASLSEVVITFTRKQSALIGDALARPGHGFASSRAGTGIGMSDDMMVMLSPKMYERFCAENNARIGAEFGGVVIHSCGNWSRWIDVVKQIPSLVMVDGAFSPQTDPDPNDCAVFRDALAGTGIILEARVVGDPDAVMAWVKRLWSPGLKLLVVTTVQDPQAQRQLYQDIHAFCS